MFKSTRGVQIPFHIVNSKVGMGLLSLSNVAGIICILAWFSYEGVSSKVQTPSTLATKATAHMWVGEWGSTSGSIHAQSQQGYNSLSNKD